VTEPNPTRAHRPVEGSDFMPSGWCGACEHCDRFPAPTVCVVCSYDAVTGMPLAQPVEWPCAEHRARLAAETETR
jgi:hypothetical protein